MFVGRDSLPQSSVREPIDAGQFLNAFQLVLTGGFVAQIRGRDSLFESCLLAGFHEQAAPHALPHDELVLLQRSSEEAWLSDGVV